MIIGEFSGCQEILRIAVDPAANLTNFARAQALIRSGRVGYKKA